MLTRSIKAATAMAALLALATFGATAQEKDKPMHEHMMDHDVTITHQVETAKTAADHEAIAKRFDAEAAEFEQQAARHEDLAKHYGYGHGGGPKANTASLAQHCKSLAKNLKASAADAREMAQLHRDVGKALAH